MAALERENEVNFILNGAKIFRRIEKRARFIAIRNSPFADSSLALGMTRHFGSNATLAAQNDKEQRHSERSESIHLRRVGAPEGNPQP